MKESCQLKQQTFLCFRSPTFDKTCLPGAYSTVLAGALLSEISQQIVYQVFIIQSM